MRAAGDSWRKHPIHPSALVELAEEHRTREGLPQPEGVLRCLIMTLVLGFVAALHTIPVGDKVALREPASRVLSASLTLRKVFGGG